MSEVTVESRGSSHNEGWQNLTEGGRWKSRSWTVKEQEAFASSTAAMLLQGRMRFSASISPSSGCPYCGCSCSAGMMTMFKNISSSSSSSSSSVASSASSLSTSVNNRTSFRPASGSFIPLGTNGWREGTKQQQTVVEETREEEEDQGKQEDEEKEDYIVPVAESQKEAQPQPGRKKGKRKRRNSSVSGSSSPSSPLTSKRDNHNSFWGRLRANTMNNSAGTEKAKGEKEKKKKAKKNKAASKKEKGSEQLAKLLDEIEEAPSSPALPRSSSSLPTSSKEKLSQQQKSAKQTEEGLKEKTWGKPVDLASLDVLNKLKHPIWIFDPDNVRMHWANHAALQLWNSPSLEELLSRDYEEDMSVATKTRIHHRREQLFSSPSESFTERWTFYPLKQPRPVRVTGSAVLVNEVHPAILAKEKKEAEKNKQEQKTERNRDNKKEQKVPKWRVSLGSTIRNKHKKQHKEESTTIREPWLAMMVEGDVDRNVDQQTLRAVEAMTHTLSMISLYRMSDLKPLYLNPAALVVHSPFLTASIPSSASSSSSSSPAASLSSSSSYVHSNQSSSLVTKLSGEEGKEQLELFTFQDRFFHAQDFEDCMQALNEGKVFDREVLMRTPSFNTVVSNDTTSNNNNNNNNSSDNVNANGHWHSLYARCTIDPATGEKAILVDEADISRRKLIEKSNSEKDSFLNMVSHEIRTPINGIIGFNSLLLETELNAEQREYVQSIQQSSKLLLAQVNDLLDIAKITEGKLLLDVVLVHFPTILSHILSLAEPLLENKFQNQKRINWNNCCSASSTHPSPSHPSRSSSPNSSSALHHSLEDLHHLHQQNEKSLRQRFKITAEIAEDVPHVLFGDPLRITQILMNFVSNAIKFTDIPDDSPDSFARVHIVISLLKKERSSSSCSTSSTLTSVTPQQKEKGDAENKTKTSEEREREEREEGVMLQMSVEDNGIGVPEDKKKYIFSSFMQADSSISRKYGGTGLGLSISKRLAQLMGGDCSFTSKVGVGSTFTATVHLQQRYQPPKLIASSSSTITTATPSTKKAEAQETLMHENSSYLFVINECDILCPSRSLSSSSSSSSSQQQESCPYRNGSQKLLCETVKRCGGWKVQVMDSWQQLRKTVLELDTGTTRIILAICNDRGHIFSRSFFSPSSSSAFPSTSTTLFEPLHQLGQQAPNDEKDYEAKEMEEIEEDRKEAEPEMYSCTLNVGGLMEEAREEGWLLGVEVWELNQDTESVLDFLNQTVFNTLEANTSQRSRSNVMKQIGSALGSSSSSIPASSTPKNIASSAAAKTTLSSVTEEEKRTNREEDKERETRAKAESGEEENNVSRKIKRQRSQSLPATSKEKTNKKNDANALRQHEETESPNEKRRKKKKTKKHKRMSAGPTDSPISIPPLWKKEMQHNLRDHENDKERDELHLGLLTVREEEEQNEEGKKERGKEGSSFRGARRMMKSSNHHHSRNLSYCNMFAGRGRHSLDWPFSTLSFSEEQSTAIDKKKRHQSCKLFSFDDDDDEDAGNDELSSTSSTSSPPFLCQSIDSVVVAGRTNQQQANNNEKQTKHENEKEGTRPKRRSITMDSSYSLNNLRSIYPSPSTSPLQPTLKPHQPKQKADDNVQGAEEEADANNFEERSININGNNRIIDVGATMLFNTARIGLSHTTLMCRKPSLSNTPRHKYNSSWVFDSAATSPPPSCSSSCSSSASPSCSSSAASSCASSSKDVYCYPSYSSSLTSSSTTSTSSSSSGLPSPLCSSRCESHSGALLRSSSASTKLSSPSATRRRHSSTNIPSASSSDSETSATSTPRSSCPSSRSCSPRCTNISSPNGVSNLRQSSTTSPFAPSPSKQVERRESTEDLQGRRREEVVYDAEDEEDEPRNKNEAQRKLERTNESSPLLLHEQQQQQKTAITTSSITTPRRVSNSPRRLFVGHDNSNHETSASRTVHRILVVEDNRMNQKLMHTILKSAGYAVELAEDGNEAVAMVKQHGAAHYSLILMDIMMPNCNGYEATMKIRQLASPSPSHPPSSSSSCSTPIDPAAATIPIVGVSATTASSVFEQCLASGMNDLIGKPYNVPALRAFLAQQLSPFSPSSASSSSSSSSSSL